MSLPGGRRALEASGLAVALASVLLCAPAPGGGAAGAPPERAPSLLLVVIDTWRWDYIGVSGSGRVATPNLDALAREGVYQREVVTPCPLTTPAHASLFTGLFPLRHGVLDCVHYRLPDGIPTLAEAFRKAGHRTAAVVSSETLRRRFGLDRGFETYEDEGVEERLPGLYASGSRDGAKTTELALRALSALPEGRPALLWVHYFDLHLPYRPRLEWDAKYPKDPYAAQAAFVDGEVGKLLRALRGEAGRTWRIAVVGDHGEGLGDHDEFGHGMALYRSTLHVPLVLHPKPVKALRTQAPWSLADVAPTLLDWFGLPALKGAEGRSLFAGGAKGRDIPCLTLLPSVHYGVNPVTGLRREKWMYMRHGREELYDLSRDPGEADDLSRDAGSRGTLEEMRGACRASIPPDRLDAILKPTLERRSGELATLYSLGYVGGPVSRLEGLQRADVAALLTDIKMLEAVRYRVRGARPKGPLIEAYRAFLKKYPRSFYGARSFGKLLLEEKQYPEAEQVFTSAARLNPGDPETLTDLGVLKMGRGRYGEARVLFEKALEVDAGNASAHLNLGILFERGLNQPGQAVPHYRRFLELAPKSAEADRVRLFLRGAGEPAPK